eukprot:scaffold38725_cov52-Attheya_sp.AAC.2
MSVLTILVSLADSFTITTHLCTGIARALWQRQHTAVQSATALRTNQGWQLSSSSSALEDGMENNRLMHAMIRVPNVTETVAYYTGRGAQVTRQNSQKSAFITFGRSEFRASDSSNEPTQQDAFQLELTTLNAPFERGNAVEYLGLSKLLEFSNNLRQAASFNAPPPGLSQSPQNDKNDVDPNGYELKSVASAPGDLLSRICLRIKINSDKPTNGELVPDELINVSDFYTCVLGMEQVAADETSVFLRYTKTNSLGVATTLVFSKNDEPLEMGNSFDHLVIGTANVHAAAEAIQEKGFPECIFLSPTPMFGTTVLGITDPNGYKLYLAETK